MGQCSRGNKIDASFSNRTDGGKLDPAAGLGFCPSFDPESGSAHLVESHIVQQDDVGSGLESLFDLFKCVSFDFNDQAGKFFARTTDGGFDGVGKLVSQGGEVIILNEDLVIKANSMVGAAAAFNRVFFEAAPTRRGLAGVEDLRFCAFDCVDKLRRQGGDSGEALDKIESHALRCQDGPSLAFDVEQGLAGLEVLAIGGGVFDLNRGRELAESGFGEGETRENQRFASDHDGGGLGVFGHGGQSRDVAGADVLGQGGLDGAADFVG